MGTSPNNVWLYGPGGARHQWSGSSWSDASTTLTAETRGEGFHTIWSSGPDAVWAISSWNRVLRKNGTSWETTGSPDYVRAIWGLGPKSLWAVDGTDVVHFYDGQTWSQASTGVGVPLEAIWASALNDVWAVGDDTVVGDGGTPYYRTTVHWDGTSWNRIAVEAPGAGSASQNALFALVGVGPNDIWASGGDSGTGGSIIHWNGTAWSEIPGSGGWRYGWASGPSDVWFYGGTSYTHWDGAIWSNGSLPLPATALSGTGPLDRFWAGGAGIMYGDGATNSTVFTGLEQVPLNTIWVTATEVYAGASNGVFLHLSR